MRNKWFRDTDREILDCGIRVLKDRVGEVTPGALYILLSDPDMWRFFREVSVEEGDEALKARARQSLDMQDNDPEQYYKHLRSALTALSIYEPGSPLHEAGVNATITPDEIINDNWIFCISGPQFFASQMGTHYALILQGFRYAQMRPGAGRTIYVLDEVCNAPLREPVKDVTVIRSYRGKYVYIAQTYKDVVNQYGENEAAILEDNCPLKIWLSFGSFAEAERVSRAMGETQVVTRGIGINSDKLDFSENISTSKERAYTPDQLMNLDPSLQVMHAKGGPWIICPKLYQNQIYPTCNDLGENPVEGGRLPPDPKVEMAVPPRRTS